MSPDFWASVLGMVAFAVASFFFALAETALFALGNWRLRQLVERSPKEGAQVQKLLEHPRQLTATIVLVNSLCNGGLVILGLWTAYLNNWPIFRVIVGLLIFVLLFCEVIPKALAVRSPELWALRIARPLSAFVGAAGPIRSVAERGVHWLLSKAIPDSVQPHVAVTDEDYNELLELAYQEGTLGHAQKEIINEIVNLDQSTAGDVMLPRTQIHGVPATMNRDEMEEAARNFKHRRLVLYDEDQENVVGILNVRSLLLHPNAAVEDIMELPSFVPESMNLLKLYHSMQRQKRGVVIVLDEFGGTAGMLTMEDILEEIVGNLPREDEAADQEISQLGPNRWMVDAAYRLEDFDENHASVGEVEEVDTVGGLMMLLMDMVPEKGSSVEHNGLRFLALDVDERHVKQVLIEKTGGTVFR